VNRKCDRDWTNSAHLKRVRHDVIAQAGDRNQKAVTEKRLEKPLHRKVLEVGRMTKWRGQLKSKQ